MVKKKRQKRITVGFVALGCGKNVVDSERMLAEIAKAGFLITADADNADVVVINTCGFIAPAKVEALEVIKQAAERKVKGKVRKIIVAGCLAHREGAGLFEEVEGIDSIVGLGQRDSIAEIIKKTVDSEQRSVYFEPCGKLIHDDRGRLLITPGHWAYLRISEGCDHSCSFCTIPAIRGRFRSKPKELILAEAAELVSAGVVELNVIAQDTAYYGKDLGVKDGLAELLGELEQIEDLKWIRLMYLYPVGITERLIETIGASKKIVHYFDIPIQHINNEILKDMRRPDSKEHICGLIEKLRAVLPGCVLRTTLITGFPGEREEQFNELLEFVRWAKFDCLGCFKYYQESGTAAAEMAEQLDDGVKQQRLEELMLCQQEIAFAKNKDRIGAELICLVDSVDTGGNGKGRFYGQAPDIDSICFIENCSAKTGELISVKVTGTKNYDLVVEQI